MLAEVFGPNLLIVVIVGMAIPLWAIIDALSRPAAAFYGAGTNKTAWVIVLLVATFVLGLGLFPRPCSISSASWQERSIPSDAADVPPVGAWSACGCTCPGPPNPGRGSAKWPVHGSKTNARDTCGAGRCPKTSNPPRLAAESGYGDGHLRRAWACRTVELVTMMRMSSWGCLRGPSSGSGCLRSGTPGRCTGVFGNPSEGGRTPSPPHRTDRGRRTALRLHGTDFAQSSGPARTGLGIALNGVRVPDTSGTGGEFYVSGQATLTDDPELRTVAGDAASYQPEDRYILFELAIAEARCHGYGDVPLPDPSRWMP